MEAGREFQVDLLNASPWGVVLLSCGGASGRLWFSMAKFVFGMNLSLDGYVDHTAFAPGPALFRHFIEQVRGLTGSVYGRRMYEVMRY